MNDRYEVYIGSRGRYVAGPETIGSSAPLFLTRDDAMRAAAEWNAELDEQRGDRRRIKPTTDDVVNNTEGTAMASKKKSAGTTATRAKKKSAAPSEPKRDPRIPPAGTILRKMFKGKEQSVRVNEHSFTWIEKDKQFDSLSSVARAITGNANISGYYYWKKEMAEKLAAR